MTYAVQFRRGTTAQHATFTGAAGEVTVNTDTNELVVHDGTTVGGHVIGTSNGSGGGASTLTDLNITDGTPGQVLTTDGAGTFTFTTLSSGSSGSTTDLSTIISPAAFAYVNTTSDGSGTNISWANWNASSGSMDFTFTTSQPDTNYAVISDVEGYDDTNIMVTSKTTTGFQISIYDDNGNVRSPGSTATFSVIVYSSVPTLSGTTSSTSTGSANVEIYTDMAALIAKTGMSTGDQAYISSTDKLYLYTGTGWYLIATVQNDAPSAITNVGSAYNLAIDGTPTVITAVSTDPEGFPLTWSYAITSGSLGSTATISQTDNVFTITPSTNSADIGTFTLTISATDGANGAVNANTSISLVFKVANSRYTTLLVTATETSDNSNVTDSSTNNHVITVQGDAMAGTFSPYRSGGYSTYFDGSGDYFTVPDNNAFKFGSENFTIECWVYFNAVSDDIIISKWNAGSTPGTNQWVLNTISAVPTFSWSIDGNFAAGSAIGTTLVANRWHHLAAVRNGSSITLYVDGVGGTPVSVSGSLYGSETEVLGISYRRNNGSTWNPINGYVSNVRLVKGTSVYTSNFTPPEEPLTAITNTSLLTCNLPYISDGSINNHTITSNGNVTTQPFSPYDYSEYNPNVHGGSVYFDGSGDYLQLPSDDGFSFGTGDFTVECWVYYPPIANTNGKMIIDSRPTSTNGSYWNFGTTSIGILTFATGGNTVSDTVARPDQWVHYAVTRSGTSLRLFANGTLVATTTDSSNISSASPTIGKNAFSGQAGDTWWLGYISNLRIVKGTAVYTSNFTPPTAPLSSTGTEIHIKGTDASIIDKSQSDGHLTLFGNTTGSTTQVKFADTKSMYLDGTGYVKVEDLDMRGDLTIECWFYQTAATDTTYRALFSASTYSFTTPLAMYSYNGSIHTYLNHTQILISGTITQNTWHHVALVRSSGTWTQYVDGVSIATSTTNGTYNFAETTDWNIGVGVDYNYPFTGYVQDFRMTNGLARYTANFTPPILPLQG